MATTPKTQNTEGAKLKVPMKHTGLLVITRIDFELHRVHAQALRDLFDGLVLAKAKLKNGKSVERPRQAVEWLLENIEPAPTAPTA